MSGPETKILLPILQQRVGLSQQVVGPSCVEGPILYDPEIRFTSN